MALIQGLISLLLEQTSITSIVAGGNAIQTIPAPASLQDYPAVVIAQISEQNDYTLTGPAGLTHARINFDCLAPQNPGGYGIARNLALAVKGELDGLIGTLPDGTRVFFAEVVNVRDSFDADATLSCTSVQVMVNFQD